MYHASLFRDQPHTHNNVSVISLLGVSSEELLAEMKKLKDAEINPEDGKVFAYVYTAEGDTFDLQKKAFDMFTGVCSKCLAAGIKHVHTYIKHQQFIWISFRCHVR